MSDTGKTVKKCSVCGFETDNVGQIKPGVCNLCALAGNTAKLKPLPREIMRCMCEQKCEHHDGRMCSKSAQGVLETIYGRYPMCLTCAGAMPVEYLKPDTV